MQHHFRNSYWKMCKGPAALRETSKTEDMYAQLFTNCGVYMLGPFLIKDDRKEFKRYGAPFPLFASRTVHNESICHMEADSFIKALLQFKVRRENIRLCRYNTSNLVGVQKELENVFKCFRFGRNTRMIVDPS